MRVLDLTHPLFEGMPVYPGTEGPRISQATTIAVEGFAEKLLTMYSHTGTHLDAPAHMLAEGATLDRLDPATFVGRAAVVEVGGQGPRIGREVIEGALPRLRGAEFLLLRSGWSRLWGRDAYYEGFPVLSREAADLVAGLGLKGLGVDMISVDPVGSTDFPVHLTLLGAGLVLVENLRGLEALGPEGFTFCCLPLPLPGGDGSPVRALALLD